MWDAVYIVSFVTWIFGAGVAWAQFRRMKKDLNGMGKKLNDEISLRRNQAETFRLIVLKIAPNAERDALIEKFLGKGI